MNSLSCVTLKCRSLSERIWSDDSEAQNLHCRDQGEIRGWIWSEGIGGKVFLPIFVQSGLRMRFGIQRCGTGNEAGRQEEGRASRGTFPSSPYPSTGSEVIGGFVESTVFSV